MTQFNKPLKYTRDQDSELNIESIISAPLIALSKANTMMLNGQAYSLLNQYFIKVGKKKKKKGKEAKEIYQPKMINMIMTKGNVNHASKEPPEIVFQVPLIAIAPLNSIAIQRMNIAFNLDITSITSYLNNSNDIIERKAQLRGKISTNSLEPTKDEKYKKTNQRTLKIDIEAGPLPLPLGVLNILELYSKNY